MLIACKSLEKQVASVSVVIVRTLTSVTWSIGPTRCQPESRTSPVTFPKLVITPTLPVSTVVVKKRKTVRMARRTRPRPKADVINFVFIEGDGEGVLFNFFNAPANAGGDPG